MEVLNGIRYVRPGNNFQPQMKLFRKIDVNGDNEHPLFSYLKVNSVKLLFCLAINVLILTVLQIYRVAVRLLEIISKKPPNCTTPKFASTISAGTLRNSLLIAKGCP